ncbi:MAG: hypothetical protein KKB90_12865 [Actinobacteria bacterium]|nr:hypothetical protein [Actinomycetota bacterium]MCG2820198.1 hypothetical protein [Actinomycetes bacterium]MBU4219830.1 hypothetical protein [Actinomycetota bacterium]MBU4357724.1 hypothetical protein [Actinomycetota bacterium]MBU4393274.1 hypothetical protein [Actinomycetota bacterium]
MADNETRENLHTAYQRESKASVRLKVYAEKADKEDYPGVARLFRAIAESETIHARAPPTPSQSVRNVKVRPPTTLSGTVSSIT